MPEITLVRQDPVQVTEADKAVARRVIFGIVDGLGELFVLCPRSLRLALFNHRCDLSLASLIGGCGFFGLLAQSRFLVTHRLRQRFAADLRLMLAHAENFALYAPMLRRILQPLDLHVFADGTQHASVVIKRLRAHPVFRIGQKVRRHRTVGASFLSKILGRWNDGVDDLGILPARPHHDFNQPTGIDEGRI